MREMMRALHTVRVRGLYVLSHVHLGSKGKYIIFKIWLLWTSEMTWQVKPLAACRAWWAEFDPWYPHGERREFTFTNCPLIATHVLQTYAHYLYLKYRRTGWMRWLQRVKAFVTKPDNLNFIPWDPEGQRRALISDSSPLATERGELTVYLSLNK